MNAILTMLVGFILLAIPGAEALADSSTINPASGNAWDFYVFGNGQVVYAIMMGLKMLMMPEAGTTGFVTLLLFMATLGFLVLAVGAGFNPSKGFVPLFGYILIVWLVTWMSTKVGTNLNITDMVPSENGATTTRTITGVPAIVGLPAAMTSQIGVYMTNSLETYMSTPTQYQMGNGVGHFNLFANMVDETTKITFQDSNLKMTLSAYMSDCVIPAIATGRLKYDRAAIGEDIPAKTFYGTDALYQSPDLLATLGTAQHKAIMTRVYDIEVAKATGSGGSVTKSNEPSATDAENTSSAMGTMMSCENAFTKIKAYGEAHANELMGKGAESFSSSGIFTPFEDVFKGMIAGAASGGGGNRGAYGNANGMVLQSAMINSMSGSFRNAAMQTGNNEIMMAANISQAEQTQKTSWAIGFASFNNMMGYVFTVLQAFIYAITPLIVVALMIPGMGKSIFVNYAQILIWLTLWQPMLAVVNFVITLFAMDNIQAVTNATGGLTMGTRGLLTERASNSILAAQFLGTMTPMISWGIVKGAMAFTEFISAGVGTQFANTAAANAAAGNFQSSVVGMNNVSMGNYSTAMSAAVGTQAVSAFSNAGAALIQQNGGGNQATANNAAVTKTQQYAESAMTSLTAAAARTNSMAQTFSESTSLTESMAEVYSKANSSQQAQMRSEIKSAVDSWGKTNGYSDADSANITKAALEAVTNSTGTKAGGGIKVGDSNSANPLSKAMGVMGISLGANFEQSGGKSDVTNLGTQVGNQLAASTTSQFGKQGSETVTNAAQNVQSTMETMQRSASTAQAHLESVMASAVLQSSFQDVAAAAQSTAGVLSRGAAEGTTMEDYAITQQLVAGQFGATDAARTSIVSNVGDTPTAAAGAELRASTSARIDGFDTSTVDPSTLASATSGGSPSMPAGAPDKTVIQREVAAGRGQIAAEDAAIAAHHEARDNASLMTAGLTTPNNDGLNEAIRNSR